jgi:hypothetical protein
MNTYAKSLLIILAVIVTSGCINGGSQTSSTGANAISVEELSVTPQKIRAGSSTNIILRLRNSGTLNTTVKINSESGSLEGDPFGDRILTNRCVDLFKVEEFTVTGPGEEFKKDKGYKLEPGAKVSLRWVLDNADADRVPLTGFDCNLKFQIPFDYSVNAFRQIQILETRETTGVEGLQSKSSAGPMKLNIATIGSTSERGPSTIIKGDNAEAIINLENQKGESTAFTGLIETEAPDITASNIKLENCNIRGEQFVMYEGESRRIRCDIKYDLGENQDRKRGRIDAETEYTYIKKLGEKTVEVEYRGN